MKVHDREKESFPRLMCFKLLWLCADTCPSLYAVVVFRLENRWQQVFRNHVTRHAENTEVVYAHLGGRLNLFQFQCRS